jgi:predicted negative regulator of RcsB-dependent stress response
MPATGAAARPPALVDEETFFEWIEFHRREVLMGVALLVVIVGGLLLYRSAIANQAIQAEQSLIQPQQALVAGNLPLAQSDLKRAITRYSGTAAAAQAAMLLAQSYYVQGRFVDGLTTLQEAPTTGAARPFAADVQELIAEGYNQQGKYHEAALAFLVAADRTEFPSARARYQASAARAYANAGDSKAAIAIWTKLKADPKSGQAGEAKLRLGELTAQAAKP